MAEPGKAASSDKTVKTENLQQVYIDDYASEGSFSQVDESERLKLGKSILIWLGIICGAVMTGYAFAPDNTALANIFELIKIGALPLVTLIIGFYFPNSKN